MYVPIRRETISPYPTISFSGIQRRTARKDKTNGTEYTKVLQRSLLILVMCLPLSHNYLPKQTSYQ